MLFIEHYIENRIYSKSHLYLKFSNFKIQQTYLVSGALLWEILIQLE